MLFFKKNDKSVSINYTLMVINYMNKLGIFNMEKILKASSLEDIMERKNGYISRNQFVFLLHNLLGKVDKEKVVIEILQTIEVSHHGFLGILAICSFTYESCLKAIIRFMPIEWDLINLEYYVENERAIIKVSGQRGGCPVCPQNRAYGSVHGSSC